MIPHQGAVDAERLLNSLQDHRVFIRKPFVAPQDRCIRVSAGTTADLAIFADVLPKALAALLA